jgi:MFS family permease
VDFPREIPDGACGMRTEPAHAAAVARDGAWDRTQRVLTVGLLLTVSMTAFEAMSVATILPATVAEIGGLAYYGWTFSAFMLAEIVGITVAGAAGDDRGLAPAFAAGGALFVAGLLAAGAAPSMPVLIASRVLQGSGAGAVSTLAYAAVARAYAPAARARMLALLSSAWVVPGLIGPATAGAVAEYAGWRWVFLALVPLSAGALMAAVAAVRGLGPIERHPARRSEAGTAVALASGTACLLMAPAVASLPLALTAAAVGLAIALPSLRRLLPTALLRGDRSLGAAIAVMALLSAAFFGAEALVPLSLTDVRHRSITMAGVTLTAATVSWTAGAWVQARLAAHGARRRLLRAGLAIMAVGIAGIAVLLAPAVPIALAAVAWGVAGLGIGIAYSTAALVVLEAAPSGEAGAASAALQLGNVLGTALGTGIGAAVLARATRAATPLAAAIGINHGIALALAVAALLCAGRVAERAASRD